MRRKVHRIAIQALEPGTEPAIADLALRLPDAVFGPTADDGVVELLVPAADLETALDRAWMAIAAEGETAHFAVLAVPGI